jgi:hypothetical protein
VHGSSITSIRIRNEAFAEIFRQSFGLDLFELFKGLGDSNCHGRVVRIAPRLRRNGTLRDERLRDFGVQKETFSEGVAAAQAMQRVDGAG